MSSPKRKRSQIYNPITPPSKTPAKKGALCFDSFPDALPKVYRSPEMLKKSKVHFPDLSPMVPTTPTYCRVALDENSPFGYDGSTLSVNSSFSRPMPDQSAFDTSISSSKRSTPQRSPCCPPTPVRQPNWVNERGRPAAPPTLGGRRNSLRTNKVLLTLPDFPQPKTCYLFSDFENMGWLGSGAFAQVYKMKSRHDGCNYAIKKSKRQFRSKRDRAQLLQEITMYEKLACAHMEPCSSIIRYYRAWQEEGYFYIQTELCEKGNLQDFTADTLPEETIWSIIRDVATGLAYIHEAGVVHLDIKPQNVFIAINGRLKIGDFGMAVEVGQNDDDSEGDSYYMAKELLSNAPIHTSADIFSFGIMLFELTTSQELPQDGQYWHELRSGQAERIPHEYSNELACLIQHMMDPNPINRPTAHDILGHGRVMELGIVPDSFLFQQSNGSNVLKQQLFSNS